MQRFDHGRACPFRELYLQHARSFHNHGLFSHLTDKRLCASKRRLETRDDRRGASMHPRRLVFVRSTIQPLPPRLKAPVHQAALLSSTRSPLSAHGFVSRDRVPSGQRTSIRSTLSSPQPPQHGSWCLHFVHRGHGGRLQGLARGSNSSDGRPVGRTEG